MFGLFKKKKDDVVVHEKIQSFGKGKVLPLEEVPDQVFAKKMMGDGYALDLCDGKIVAPISGEVMLVFPTGHAFGIKGVDGTEILLHLGIDTVELNGEGFNSQVKQGDKVKQGDVLTLVDLDFVKSKGKSMISPFILTSGQQVELLKVHEEVSWDTQDIFTVK